MLISPTWISPVVYPEAAALRTSTPELLRDAVAADPGRIFVIDEDYRISGAELLDAVTGIQQWLQRNGVQAGTCVGMQLPNWWEAVAVAHAVWGLGAVLCPIPVNYRSTEIRAVLDAVTLAAVVIPDTYRGVDHVRLLDEVQATRTLAAPVLVIRPEMAPVAYSRTGDSAPILCAGLDAISLLMFTSGTTGRAKGVLHSHRSLLADADSIAKLFDMSDVSVFMPSPVAHVTGLVYGVLMPLLMGGNCVLQHRWDPAVAVAMIETNQCRTSVGATPFLRGLTDEYRSRAMRSSLTSFICGGADVPQALVREAEQVMGTTVVRAYGLTEMPTVTCGGPTDSDDIRSTTDGRLTGSSRARIIEPAADGSGELEVRGPELCAGYLDPRDTADAFSVDGWFRTGDLARIAGDTITIVGRAKDLIVRGGENISAKEVEDLLLDLEDVKDVALVGLPDPLLGEKACAVMVVDGAQPSLSEITAYLLTRGVAKYKIPEYLLSVAELPRTPSGKIQKFRVRDEAARILASGSGERR
ncbi:AMP-binding protein [Rhodococcus globerulus]|uniref:AMP-binding protein n=1 Tax=Rhodococcus globerulus TaxID=33008 RepID=A0ABU4C2C5_RHOGO|nr:AMP-binding protein [Rhodococcus globerulus]MDV6270621.1 AMP-binding protein [Rhodococcus globerulus]